MPTGSGLARAGRSSTGTGKEGQTEGRAFGQADGWRLSFSQSTQGSGLPGARTCAEPSGPCVTDPESPRLRVLADVLNVPGILGSYSLGPHPLYRGAMLPPPSQSLPAFVGYSVSSLRGCKTRVLEKQSATRKTNVLLLQHFSSDYSWSNKMLHVYDVRVFFESHGFVTRSVTCLLFSGVLFQRPPRPWGIHGHRTGPPRANHESPQGHCASVA